MPTPATALSQRHILRFWFPLALMWLMMAIEHPVLAGVIARMAEPKEQLASFGVTFALALLIESPIIMLLVAGTALARGQQSYRQLLLFATVVSAFLTGLHLLIALTPLFGLFVGRFIGAPAALVEPARQAFLLMLPWTAAVAYRRLWQGVMIRYGKTDQVGVTTAIRLMVTGIVAISGMLLGYLPGAALAGLALSLGVIAGAVAARAFVQPILDGPLRQEEAEEDRISLAALLDFYVPLALTNVINHAGRPLLTLGLGRAILPLESLALWPVLMSLAFLLRSIGFAYQEVVVALMGDAAALAALRRFAVVMGSCCSALLLLIALTPLNDLWYGVISGLTPDLVELARLPTLLIWLAPATAFIVAWQRGVLVSVRRTRPISAAVAVNLAVLVAGLWLGLIWLPLPGVAIASGAFMLSMLAEVGFLTWQMRSGGGLLTRLSTTPA